MGDPLGSCSVSSQKQNRAGRVRKALAGPKRTISCGVGPVRCATLQQGLLVAQRLRRGWMEGSFADELYSESLQLSKMQLDSAANVTSKQSGLDDHGKVQLSVDNGCSWYGSDDEVNETSDMDKEWQRRHDQFHTMGYRDGLIAGKEASSQEGFNIGFKQSVLVGYNWGLVRDVTSALASLPDGTREKLTETEEQRTRFQGLCESVHSLSTTDAFRLFNDEITSKKDREQISSSETSSFQVETVSEEQRVDHSGLGVHSAKLRSLILESPRIKVNIP
ncbi:hypothetical protein ACLB2K_077450 [Fragaria x ananassa]